MYAVWFIYARVCAHSVWILFCMCCLNMYVQMFGYACLFRCVCVFLYACVCFIGVHYSCAYVLRFLVCALGRYFVRYFIFTACVTMRAHSFTFFTCLGAYFMYVFLLWVLMYLSARKWGCNSLAYEYIQILETWFLQKLTALRLMCPNAHLSKCGSWLFRSTAISPRSLWSFRWRKLMLGFMPRWPRQPRLLEPWNYVQFFLR